MGVLEGREAIRALFEDWIAAYEDFEQVIEELRDLGNRVICGVSRQRARLPGSSGLVELGRAAVLISRDGLVDRVTAYSDIHHARAAAERFAEEQG
jgi:hypothetical protein